MVGFLGMNDRAVRVNLAIDAIGPIDCHAQLGNPQTAAGFYAADNRAQERSCLVAQLSFHPGVARNRFFQIRHVAPQTSGLE